MKRSFKLFLTVCGFFVLHTHAITTQPNQTPEEIRQARMQYRAQKKLRREWSTLCETKDDPKEAKRILDAGLDPHVFLGSWNLLHEAAALNRPALVEQALKYGADPNLPTTDNCLPLEIASINLNVEIVKILLTYSANPKKPGRLISALTRAERDQQYMSNEQNPDSIKLAQAKEIVRLLKEQAQLQDNN